MPTLSNFIEDYLLFTSGNESPPLYHKWVCLSTLSALVGRRFWITNGHTTYYTHLYTLLVGDAGVRKSAAMDRGKDLVRDVGGIRVGATMSSVQAITKEMSDEKFIGRKTFINQSMGNLVEEFNQYSIFATEFTDFLGNIAPEAMASFLTGIWTDKIYDETYKGTGNSCFVGPYITLCGCLTPSSMKGFLKQTIIGSGFARRTVFVWATRGPGVARPSLTQEQKDARARCVLWGKEIAKHSGEMIMSPETWAAYDEWYLKNYNSINDRKPNLQGYYSSKHDLLFKTSILATLAIHGPEAREIDFATWEFLDKQFFLPMEENLERVFEGAGINPNSDGVIKVVRMLESVGLPFSKKKLEAMFLDNFTSTNELRDCLSHLVAVGRLQEKTISVNGVLLGTCIGTPEAMQKATNEEMATILMKKRL